MPRTAAAKPAHPVDVRRSEILAAPAGFTATIRSGGRANTLNVPTLADAAKAAAALEEGAAQVYGTSARASVYALAADGGRGEVVTPADWRKLVSEAERAAIRAGIAANLRRAS